MLPKHFYKYFGLRNKIAEWGLGTYYQWDKEKEELKPGRPIQLMSMWTQFYSGGLCFTGMHMARMYMKTHRDDILEEGETEQPPLTLKDFATLMIEGGEILSLICLSFLNYTFLNRLDEFMFLFNQLLSYNKMLSGMIETGKLVLTKRQKIMVEVYGVLMECMMAISFIIVPALATAITAKIEPTNRLIYEWLEKKFTLSYEFSPMIALLMLSGMGAGSTVSMMGIMISLYYLTTTIATEAFIPEGIIVTPRTGQGRCKLETPGFGELTDEEVIHMFRTQQVLNVLLNAFFKSVLVSFHHVGALACFVCLFVFLIKYNEIIGQHGPMGYIVVLGAMFVPLIIIFFQARMAGAVVDTSEDFKMSGKRLARRNFLFRKFSSSCTTFYIEVAYPFYTIHKETFAMFCEHAQDYSMELLLW